MNKPTMVLRTRRDIDALNLECIIVDGDAKYLRREEHSAERQNYSFESYNPPIGITTHNYKIMIGNVVDESAIQSMAEKTHIRKFFDPSVNAYAYSISPSDAAATSIVSFQFYKFTKKN